VKNCTHGKIGGWQQHWPWGSDAENPVLLAWLVQWSIAVGKTQHSLHTQQEQYCILP